MYMQMLSLFLISATLHVLSHVRVVAVLLLFHSVNVDLGEQVAIFWGGGRRMRTQRAIASLQGTECPKCAVAFGRHV